jgi:hypothetical protein
MARPQCDTSLVCYVLCLVVKMLKNVCTWSIVRYVFMVWVILLICFGVFFCLGFCIICWMTFCDSGKGSEANKDGTKMERDGIGG